MSSLHQGGTQEKRVALRVLPLLHLPALSFWPGQIPDPGSKVMRRGKALHLCAGLRDDNFGHTPVDAWSAIQTVDVIIVFAQQRFEEPVQLRDTEQQRVQCLPVTVR